MKLNTVEFALMNNPLRAAVQRLVEAKLLRRMGGAMEGGRALEIGCGRGVGIGIILTSFNADRVDAFDLDPRMIVRARARHRADAQRVQTWVGSATAICAADESYDAVFDFGIIHHVHDWRSAVREAARVLKPGGRLYAEEALGAVITNPLVRRLTPHPQIDRFDSAEFGRGLRQAGLEITASRELPGVFAWFVAVKPSAGSS